MKVTPDKFNLAKSLMADAKVKSVDVAKAMRLSESTVAYIRKSKDYTEYKNYVAVTGGSKKPAAPNSEAQKVTEEFLSIVKKIDAKLDEALEKLDLVAVPKRRFGR